MSKWRPERVYVPPVSLLVVIYVAKSFVKKKNTHTHTRDISQNWCDYVQKFLFWPGRVKLQETLQKRVLSSNTNSNIDGLGYLHVELFLICRVRASHPLHTASNFAKSTGPFWNASSACAALCHIGAYPCLNAWKVNCVIWDGSKIK